MNIRPLRMSSPPALASATHRSADKESISGPEDAFQKSERSTVSIGAGILAAVSLLGMSACTPPPHVGHEAPPEAVAETTVPDAPIELAKDDGKPLTELEIRQRELALREREVAVREKELAVSQKREQGESRLRKLQEQREAHEKAERIGKGIGDTITILDGIGSILVDGANEVLR
jgi:hypothetical protein